MNNSIQKIAIFCGASSGNDPIYIRAAEKMADALIEANISLVYGGGKVGLMGTLADRMLNANKEVIGVIPQLLVEKELAHSRITKLHVVSSMHERKLLISESADGFILLPGGAGSLDEFFEAFTWAQLGFHRKPLGILNAENYFDHLINFLKYSVEEGFLNKTYQEMIIVENEPKKLIQRFLQYQAPAETRWTKKTGTDEN